MRSLLFTIPSLNDSSYLTSQQGKIWTGTFRLYNVQQIDQYGGLQTVKTVSCSAASAMACYKLWSSWNSLVFFNLLFHLASVLSAQGICNKEVFAFNILVISHDSIGKFITWRGNSTLNCTRKPISHESRSEECDIGFQGQFNVEFSSQVMNFPWIA